MKVILLAVILVAMFGCLSGGEPTNGLDVQDPCQGRDGIAECLQGDVWVLCDGDEYWREADSCMTCEPGDGLVLDIDFTDCR